MRRVLITTLVLSSALFGSRLPAQEPATPDPLFAGDEILEVRLSGPLRELIDRKSKEDYLPGTFSVVSDGETLDFDVRFRARGNFRHENCDYPPVRLNFKKSQTKNTLFDKQNKLKMVIHCNRRAEYQQIVLQEYLAYRVLNLLTDFSLRVRLLRIVYADPDESFESEPRYAFLIEHKNRAARRFGMQPLAVPRVQVAALDAEQLNLTSVFQFFIGNTDFSPIAAAPGDDCCHNYILFEKDGANFLPVPYDFDQAGFVDAPYAVPNPTFRLRTVKQRRYRGRCVNNSHIDSSMQKLLDNRDAIYALIREQEGFADATRQQLIAFVDSYYELAKDPKRVERMILKRCV